MLRALFIALLLLNALFFGWTRGWLDDIIGLKARGDREPERLARQLHPERIELLNPQAATALQKTSCLQLGPLDGDAALQAAQAALERAGVPADAWTVQTAEQPGVWAVATIRLPNKDFQARKEETYKKMRIDFEYLQGPPEEQPSLLLSRHASPAEAEAALQALSQRALKGLRVLQLQPALRQHSLVVAAADTRLRGRLDALKDAALAPGFRPCEAAAPAAAAPSTPAPAGSATAG
jgi:hypothetical protein